jgi:hypothetical protein
MESRVVQLRASPATFQGLMDVDRQLGVDREPDLVLAFLPTKYLEDTLSAMAEVWPSSRRLGCESVAQIADSEYVEKGSLQFLWLDDPTHELDIELVAADDEDVLDPGALERFQTTLYQADAALILIDGVRFPHTKLLTELGKGGTLPPLLGALASRCGDAREGGRIFIDTQIHASTAVLVAMKGVTLDTLVVHPFTAASPAYTITRAAGNVAYEIDGEAATLWFRRFFTVAGELLPLPSSALPFPLIIEGPHPTRRGLYRTMTDFDEVSGTVSFRGDVQVGDRIRLGLRRSASLKEVATSAAEHRPQAAILSTSLSWGLGEDEDTMADVAAARDILGIPLGGLGSFGEIVLDTAGSLGLHNQVIALAALREMAS